MKEEMQDVASQKNGAPMNFLKAFINRLSSKKIEIGFAIYGAKFGIRKL